MKHVLQQDISAWLDGQLDAVKAAELEAHLQQCESCRRSEAELASTTQMYRDLEPLEMPAFLWSRIEAELEQPSERRRPAWAWWQGAWLFGRRELMGAAALVVIVAALSVGLLEHRATIRSEAVAFAQLESVHNSLAARNSDFYNPFHASGPANSDLNPFTRLTRRGHDVDSNPFGSLREKR